VGSIRRGRLGLDEVEGGSTRGGRLGLEDVGGGSTRGGRLGLGEVEVGSIRGGRLGLWKADCPVSSICYCKHSPVIAGLRLHTTVIYYQDVLFIRNSQVFIDQLVPRRQGDTCFMYSRRDK